MACGWRKPTEFGLWSEAAQILIHILILTSVATSLVMRLTGASPPDASVSSSLDKVTGTCIAEVV